MASLEKPQTTNETPREKWEHGVNSMNMTACGYTRRSPTGTADEGNPCKHSAMRLTQASLPHATVNQGLPLSYQKHSNGKGEF